MSNLKILRLPAVQEATGKSRSGIYSDIAIGRFPAPIRLGRRAIGWRTEDIDTWIASRESARPAGNGRGQ
ncbi:MAG: AlpA family phage regulatory protein [Parvibaculum sp.]|uniref:helix-turn-helix transcriptional regulator n=1 Tax=Parvibaculum sp. TaxID=2024848 RepID=UPI00285072F8|nr:AlpA family phage regulatory protein [Parvibaculum sp.]MDR3499936.1 AlpA family phage regulatory protein [Parvibaculum sp.]